MPYKNPVEKKEKGAVARLQTTPITDDSAKYIEQIALAMSVCGERVPKYAAVQKIIDEHRKIK
jgi:hypothetical protein